MILPGSSEKLGPWALQIIDRCRASCGQRAAMARAVKTWTYTGSPDGQTAILNRLFPHLARTSSLLFSPSDLRFHMDFTHNYPKNVLDQAEVCSRSLTRVFEQRDIDLRFGEGVFTALQHGACIPKVLHTHDGISSKNVMPWQIGVYREDLEDFGDQEAVCETSMITLFDLWRRISHLPNAVDLFKRARSYARRQGTGEDTDTYLHQVLIAGTTPVVQTDPPFMSQPGGLVGISAEPQGAVLAPEVVDELIEFHELWVWDDEQEDYTTIQMCEPDILIAPLFRRRNMFIPEYLPYGKICPNTMPGLFWGRSEIADLMKLQHLLRDRLEDVKKLMSLQYDRRYAFIGGSGMTDEDFDAMLQSGWVARETGDVKDITPELPKEWAQDIQEIMGFMDEISGFQNILSGQGEPGVRAGNHAQTLLRTASPRMKDRALLIERQCADFATKVFEAMRVKEAKAFWTKDGADFLMAQIPEDYRIMVDSHSSSPIYEMDHQQIAFALAKLQVIGGEDLIDLLPLPRRDLLKEHYSEMQKAKAAEIKHLEEHPELAQALKAKAGGKKH